MGVVAQKLFPALGRRPSHPNQIGANTTVQSNPRRRVPQCNFHPARH
jgi:hypothetical protein